MESDHAAPRQTPLTLSTRFHRARGEQIDFTPSLHWPEPHVQVEPRPDQGPVLVTVNYLIELERSRAFIRAMGEVRRERLRDGGMQWGLFTDPVSPNHYLETFLVESWAEHMRQHERVTISDREAEEVARAFHIGDTPPNVSHFIYAKRVRRENDNRTFRQ